jgi:O-methyltransferase involved in polyketide biosynthesis
MSSFDTSAPNVARVYDYLLGGKDNFEVDRMMAANLVKILPPLPLMLRDNRRFVARAVSWVANQGVSQFIDLGAGFPTRPSVHESVHAVNASALVAYVDYDPVVVSHLNGLVASHDDRVIVIPGDVGEPEAVLAAVRGSSIDLGAPACVIIALVLHFMDAETAASLARQYTAALAPGSYVIITIGRGDGEVADQFNAAYNAEISGARLYNHSVAEFASFFSGLEVIPPGFTDAQLWRAGWQDTAEPGPAVGRAFVGVARVP